MRGSIIVEQAYAQGKMLDHSSWQHQEKLPRSITPSDIDFVIDNDGNMLFCELSKNFNKWEDLGRGQKWVYQSAIRKGPHCSVLCQHDTEWDGIIDTRYSIIGFQVMVFDYGSFRVSKIVEGNRHWQNFVLAWCRNADGLRGEVIEKSTIVVA